MLMLKNTPQELLQKHIATEIKYIGQPQSSFKLAGWLIRNDSVSVGQAYSTQSASEFNESLLPIVISSAY